MRGWRRFFVLPVSLLILLLAWVPAQGVVRTSDAPTGSDSSEDYAFVRFNDPPLASYDGSIQGFASTKPGKGEKLNLNTAAARKYGNRLAAQRQNYIKWLNKQYPQVQVVTEYDATFNGVGLKLNGATLRQVQGGPGTAEAGYSNTYTQAMNVSRDVLNAGALATALGGQANAGAGIMVGIIDSGIDQAHPFLQPNADMAMPEGYPRGELAFTSNKVIVAKTFHQTPGMTAEAVGSHGTHVAGTVAGMAGTNGPMAANLSGMAPGAWLGNYNVFPGNTENAKSLFIAKAVEEAVKDGMDVINLSLGGRAHQGKDILDMAVDAAADAGVVVAIAAGNEGPGYYTVGSPGTASNVITVAAITNAHQFTGLLHSAALPAPVLATTGDGAGKLTSVLTGTYDVWADYAAGDTLACAPLGGTPLAGKIALVQRGVCTFSEKINNAAAAGAIAVILYQREDVAGDPIAMSTDGVTIPAVMITRDAGHAMAAWSGDRTVTMEPAMEHPSVSGLMADFTSWGPTPNYTLKPDVAAVGVNVYSSVPGGGFEAWNGTSMATPHVAGASVLLLSYSRQMNWGWGPAEVKAALMATARPATDTDDPLKVGAGIIDLGRAMNPPALAWPSSLSFGLVRPVGNHTYQVSFTLNNTSGATQTYTLTDSNGGIVSVSPASVTLAPGDNAVMTATVVDRGAPSPGQGGYPELRRGIITAQSDTGAIRIPYLYVMDYNR